MTPIDIARDLPLLGDTPRAWAELAVARLDRFLSDHAVCEQQAALTALNLVAHYPEDEELVDRLTALAAEEVVHFRRVVALLRQRGLRLSRRRRNPYVQALHERVERERAPQLKTDRLIVGALIEARSCERFTRVLELLPDGDADVARLLSELGPAERRHWGMFHGLARRGSEPEAFERRWQGWLVWEHEVNGRGGKEPTVHG
jgi:tRNA-(ms[2]io[6]A)-hydroxylase